MVWWSKVGMVCDLSKGCKDEHNIVDTQIYTHIMLEQIDL